MPVVALAPQDAWTCPGMDLGMKVICSHALPLRVRCIRVTSPILPTVS